VKVLIVDDSPEVVESVRLNFLMLWPGSEVIAADTGRTALRLIESGHPDIVLLDIGLPDINGLDVLEQLRLTSDVPVIVLTARDMTPDKIRGLRLGADDYVTKPFNHQELIERVRAVLRRLTVPQSGAASFAAGEFEMDFEKQEARLAGRVIDLTPTEYRLLYYLVQSAGVVQRQEVLLRKVWGEAYKDETDYVRAYVHRLREKLGDAARHIVTERGFGYLFDPSR